MSTINKYPRIKTIIDMMTDDEKNFVISVLNTTDNKNFEALSVLPPEHDIAQVVIQNANYKALTGILWHIPNVDYGYYLIDIYSGQFINLYRIDDSKFTKIKEVITLLELRFWIEGGAGGTGNEIVLNTSAVAIQQDEYYVGQLTEEQLEILNTKSVATINVALTYSLASIDVQFRQYLGRSKGRIYTSTVYNSFVSLAVDMSSGQYALEVSKEDYISEGAGTPTEDANVPHLYLDNLTGRLYEREYLEGGFYDKNGDLLLEWNNAGVESDLSNIADVVASLGDVYKIIVGSTATSIAENAFSGVSVYELFIPDTITTISSGAFNGIQDIVKMDLPFAGGTQNAEGSTRLFGYIFGGTSYANSVQTKQFFTSTSYSTFYLPTTLIEVIIRNGNNSNVGGNRTFNECNVIQKLTIINHSAISTRFAFNCTALTEFNIIKGNVENYTLGQYALRYTGLTELNLPEGLVSITNPWGFEKVKELYLKDDCQISEPEGLEALEKIYVPDVYVDNYKATWTNLADKIEGGYKDDPTYTDENKTWVQIPTEQNITPEILAKKIEGSETIVVDINEEGTKLQVKIDETYREQIENHLYLHTFRLTSDANIITFNLMLGLRDSIEDFATLVQYLVSPICYGYYTNGAITTPLNYIVGNGDNIDVCYSNSSQVAQTLSLTSATVSDEVVKIY